MSEKNRIEWGTVDGQVWLHIPGLTSKPKPKRRHRHTWYVDNVAGTYCGTCGKPHPTEGRS